MHNIVLVFFMASVRLPEELEFRLCHVMELTRRSKSFVIKEALELYLDDIEDGLVALERMAKPNNKFYTSEEVLKRLEET